MHPESSTPYIPQSNRLAERFNRTLLDKVRSMLHGARLYAKFWGEAALYATYFTNLTIHKANYGCTPYEILLGYKSDVSKTRISRCLAYVHEPKKERVKVL